MEFGFGFGPIPSPLENKANVKSLKCKWNVVFEIHLFRSLLYSQSTFLLLPLFTFPPLCHWWTTKISIDSLFLSCQPPFILSPSPTTPYLALLDHPCLIASLSWPLCNHFATSLSLPPCNLIVNANDPSILLISIWLRRHEKIEVNTTKFQELGFCFPQFWNLKLILILVVYCWLIG